jgi:signal transduction histidine kinase
MEMRRRELDAARIRHSVAVADGLPPVIADPHQLRQVFLNIVLDAEHALRAGGSRLEVAVDADGARGGVEVRFFNDGPPIPPDALPHVFDPFFTTKPRDEGTGLGLAICRRIVQEHGGELTVESGERGTAFTIRLPAAEEGIGPLPPG